MIWAVAFAVALLGLIVFLNGFFPGAPGGADKSELIPRVLLAALIGGSLILGFRSRAAMALKYALVWIAVTFLLVLGYSYRGELRAIVARVGGELVPGMPTVTTAGEVELRASSDGHFQAYARINGARVSLLVDTGATVLALAPGDAERIGIDLEALRFDRPVRTANGRTYVAWVRLESVEIGPITFADVDAAVHRDGLDQSLLGMNVLDRLRGFERTGDRLILKP